MCKQTGNNEPCSEGETPAPLFPKIDYFRFKCWSVNTTESQFSLTRYNSSHRFRLSKGEPELPAYMLLFYFFTSEDMFKNHRQDCEHSYSYFFVIRFVSITY